MKMKWGKKDELARILWIPGLWYVSGTSLVRGHVSRKPARERDNK